MLIFFARPLFFGIDHQFGEVAIAYILRCPLGEEVDIIFIIFVLIFLLKGLSLAALMFLLLFALYSQLLIEADSPLIGVNIFIVVLNPCDSLLLSHLQFILHYFINTYYLSPYKTITQNRHIITQPPCTLPH